jgi:hypothetical protein
MSFGKMITLIDIIETTTSQDEEGFVKKEDNIIASTRAYREERRPSRKWVNLAAYTEADALFQLRVIPGLDLKAGMLLVCDTGSYTIINVEKVKGLYLEVLAKKLEPTKA